MKKFLIGVFILVDLLVIGVATLFLIANIKGTQPEMLKNMPPIPGLPSASKPATALTPVSTTSIPSAASSTETLKTTSPIAPAASNVNASTNSRKILFTYRNSKAKKVEVRADFTGWRAEPMEKDAATGTWRYMAILEPGEYAYCYSVDDKSIRDPANKHTKTVGKTIVSSIIVQPPAASGH